MKKSADRTLIILVIVLLVWSLWCYIPIKNIQTIKFKMELPLPFLYSQCVNELGKLGTQEAISVLLTELNSDSRSKRNLAAKALAMTTWHPKSQEERIKFLVSLGRYQEVADFGEVAIPYLVDEFEETDDEHLRSKLCAALMKFSDKRASSLVQQYLDEKLEKIGAILQEALPPETEATTTISKESASVRRVVIAGHLLKGEDVDDDSPYVRGEYANKSTLESKARYRCFQIYKSIFHDLPMTEFKDVVVSCKHGVRVQVVTLGMATIPGVNEKDQAMTIFQTSLSPRKAQKVDWGNATLKDVEKVWTVDKNIIPSLEIRTAY